MAVVDISNTYQLTNVGAHIDNTDVINSNRNLLDNPFFQVNQRGNISYNSEGYSVDRWLSNGTQQVTVSSGGVTLGEQGYRFVQRMENPATFAGETLTISAKTNAANVRFAYWDSTSGYNNGSSITVPVVDGYASLTINITNGIYAIGLSTASGTGGLYRAMKLELGSVSTLENDVPPDYGTELWHCQRARWQNTGSYIMTASAVSETQAIAVMPLPNVLFKTPTLEQQGAFVLADRVNPGIAVTTIQLLPSDLQTCALLIITEGGLTRGVTYGLALNGTGRFALNADL